MSNNQQYTVQARVIGVQEINYDRNNNTAELGDFIEHRELLRAEIYTNQKQNVIGIIHGDLDKEEFEMQIEEQIEEFEDNEDYDSDDEQQVPQLKIGEDDELDSYRDTETYNTDTNTEFNEKRKQNE